MQRMMFFFQNHLENCKRVPIKCINNCGRTDIPRDQVCNLKALFSSPLDTHHLLLYLLKLSLFVSSFWCQLFTAGIVTISQLTQINKEDLIHFCTMHLHGETIILLKALVMIWWN